MEQDTGCLSEYNPTPRLDRRAAFLSSADQKGAATPVSALSEVAEQWGQVHLGAGVPNHGRPREAHLDRLGKIWAPKCQ